MGRNSKSLAIYLELRMLMKFLKENHKNQKNKKNQKNQKNQKLK